ncbi:hypothetical protein BDW22DRAFT_1050162 [Trametopsis cervina]|nr:hypothetical protein BDW22DRAFT_1050162 [Trametopsis cervina]
MFPRRNTLDSPLQHPQSQSSPQQPQSPTTPSSSGVKTEEHHHHHHQQQQQQGTAHLYRLSPSPVPFDTGSFSPQHYPSPPSSYPTQRTNTNDLYYHQPYLRDTTSSTSSAAACGCLTNPAAGHPLIALTQQLGNTLELLRQLPEHAHAGGGARGASCVILRQVALLSDLMHGGSGATTPPTPFDTLSTPDSELLSPVSTSSHSSLNGAIHPGEWPMPTASQYDSYFPVGSGEAGMYHKAYHIN